VLFEAYGLAPAEVIIDVTPTWPGRNTNGVIIRRFPYCLPVTMYASAIGPARVDAMEVDRRAAEGSGGGLISGLRSGGRLPPRRR